MHCCSHGNVYKFSQPYTARTSNRTKLSMRLAPFPSSPVFLDPRASRGLYYKASPTYPGSLSVTCFTDPNNSNRAKRYHEGGYQLCKSTQGFRIQERIHMKGAGFAGYDQSHTGSVLTAERQILQMKNSLILEKHHSCSC